MGGEPETTWMDWQRRRGSLHHATGSQIYRTCEVLKPSKFAPYASVLGL